MDECRSAAGWGLANALKNYREAKGPWRPYLIQWIRSAIYNERASWRARGFTRRGGCNPFCIKMAEPSFGESPCTRIDADTMLATLPDDDAVILRMHFAGHTVEETRQRFRTATRKIINRRNAAIQQLRERFACSM